MNDAECDAWLREALRHAPDSDAVPPSGVSEAILLKARAAARGADAGGAACRRARRAREPLDRALGLAGAPAGRRWLRQRDGSDAGRPDVVGPADRRGDAACARGDERSCRRDTVAGVDPAGAGRSAAGEADRFDHGKAVDGGPAPDE